MTEMPERTAWLRGVLIVGTVLVTISSLSALPGQSRGPRGATTHEVAPSGAGIVAAPEAGYVTAPESAPPGTVYPAAIPSDEFDRAFWELYDRDKHITISGKVTRVNWTNPNSYIFVQASGVEWAVEA